MLTDRKPGDVLTPTQAAQLLEVHVGSVRRWILRGELPAWRKGGRIEIRRVDLEAMLQPVEVRQRVPIPTGRARAKSSREAEDVLRKAGILR